MGSRTPLAGREAPGGLLSDDVDTPGGSPPLVLEPRQVTADGPWLVYAWPEPDVRVGSLVALRVPFPCDRGESYLANGWQSWSAPTVRRLGHPATPPPPRGVSRRHLLRMTGAGDASYDLLATGRAVAGFTAGGGLLVADTRSGAAYAVRRHAGSPHPPVLVATGDGPTLVDDLLDRAGGRVPRDQPVCWSTWKAFGDRIDAERITRSLAAVRVLVEEALCDLVLVDDGWQRALGDWDARQDRFPAGLAALAGEVREAGARVGLWTAPLLVSPRAELAARRPEWIARHPDGRPVVGTDLAQWGPTWVLDATLPDVRRHLAAVAAEHAAAGITMFKLDFLYAAADAADAALARRRAGLPRRGDLLGADAVTVAVLEAIRSGAGESVTLLGCGAPLWPSIGHVDWMRVGPDVTGYYRPHEEPQSDPAMVSCLRNGWRASALRAPMHRRLWGNDPDSLQLDPRRTHLTPEKRLGFARWVASSGQLLTLSDDVEALGPRELAEWRRIVQRSRSVTRTPPERALAEALSVPAHLSGTRPTA